MCCSHGFPVPKFTSRPFFLTQALRPSTFQEVIFMLAERPSLLVILSGGSSYSTGASGSFPFFPFLVAGAELKVEHDWYKWYIQIQCLIQSNLFYCTCYKTYDMYYVPITTLDAAPAPFSWSSPASSSFFFPLFDILALALNPHTPCRHTTRAHNNTRAAEREKKDFVIVTFIASNLSFNYAQSIQ